MDNPKKDNLTILFDKLEHLLKTDLLKLMSIDFTKEQNDKIYNQKVLPLIYDSIPLNLDWDNEPDVRENPDDIETPYMKAFTTMLQSHTMFITDLTKKEYLFNLANSLVEYSKNPNVRESVEIIYQLCFVIDFPKAYDKTALNDLLKGYEEKIKSGENNYSDVTEGHNFMLDNQELPVQIRYHRWAITNKKKVLHTSYMRNRFINNVAENHFKNYLSNNLGESHAKLNTDFLHHMDLPNDLAIADTLRKWIGIFTKSVMLVYYGYYKWDKIKGDFYNKEGEKLPQGDRPNSEAFYRYLEISVEEIRDWGNKYRKETPKRNYGSRGRTDKRADD